ncbi:MAG: altronate dehydratase family protein [Pseudomonadota bacterium]
MSVSSTIITHPKDDVAIALKAISAGETVAHGIVVREPIAPGHKIALCSIKESMPVLRYGQIIGFASSDIAEGEHVHTHNLTMGDFERDYAFASKKNDNTKAVSDRTFMGYRRPGGNSATRNYIGIITTVNCSAHVAAAVSRYFEAIPGANHDPLKAYPNVDGVVALTHSTGCGMSRGEPLEILQRTLLGYAKHPNFSHILIIGLGCEVNQIGGLMVESNKRDNLKALSIQSTGGTKKTIDAATDLIKSWLPESNAIQREPIPVAELCVALICGGSDGYSGVSANPALGVASDLLVSHGASVILSETPETYGAEHLLTRRAESQEIGEKLVDVMRWWEDYGSTQGASLNANPSPGNKRGGLTTILEKSLGALSKGGSSNLVDVVYYAQKSPKRGLIFMDAPGYDPVQVTGQIASGANLVAFTTGRGSVFGSKPAPTLKLASNSKMFAALAEDMDIDCGGILDGTDTIDECGARIFEALIELASGRKSQSERQNIGENEFAPWVLGPVI